MLSERSIWGGKLPGKLFLDIKQEQDTDISELIYKPKKGKYVLSTEQQPIHLRSLHYCTLAISLDIGSLHLCEVRHIAMHKSDLLVQLYISSPLTLPSPTFTWPKPWPKQILINKFHFKERQIDPCWLLVAFQMPHLDCLGTKETTGVNWSVHPFMSWQLWSAVRVKDCLPKNLRHTYLWSDYIYFISPVSYCMAITDTITEPQGCNRYLNKDTSRLLNGNVHRKQI